MSIGYSEFMETAARLSASANEADLRSAVSRAYYSVLHGTVSALPPDRAPKDEYDGSSHAAVIGEARGYGNAIPPLPGRAAAIRVAEKLGRLKAKRKKADYRLNEDIGSPFVNRALADASSALDDITEWTRRQADAAA